MLVNIFRWYYSFCVAMCFYFSQYYFFVHGIYIADFLLFSSCILGVLYTRKIKIQYATPIVYYYFISIILFLITISIYGFYFPLVPFWKVITRIIHYGIYTLLILLVVDNSPFKDLNTNGILKIYRFFCYLFAIYTIIQALGYFLFHYMLPANILPIPWSRDLDTSSILLYAQDFYFRGFGPFLEPSYLSKFLLPGLTLSLLGWGQGEKSKKDWILFFIILCAILFSTSVQGMLISAIIIFTYIVVYKRLFSSTKILLLFIIFIVGLIFLLSNITSVSIDRIYSIFIGQSHGYSTNLRLFRGFAFWYEMPLLFKIIGTGLGNMGNFAHIYDIYTIYDYPIREVNFLEYCSGLSGVLIHTGIFGFSIIFYWFYKSFQNLNLIGRILLFQFLLIQLSGSGIFSITSVFYCALIFIYKRDKI